MSATVSPLATVNEICSRTGRRAPLVSTTSWPTPHSDTAVTWLPRGGTGGRARRRG